MKAKTIIEKRMSSLRVFGSIDNYMDLLDNSKKIDLSKMERQKELYNKVLEEAAEVRLLQLKELKLQKLREKHSLMVEKHAEMKRQFSTGNTRLKNTTQSAEYKELLSDCSKREKVMDGRVRSLIADIEFDRKRMETKSYEVDKEEIRLSAEREFGSQFELAYRLYLEMINMHPTLLPLSRASSRLFRQEQQTTLDFLCPRWHFAPKRYRSKPEFLRIMEGDLLQRCDYRSDCKSIEAEAFDEMYKYEFNRMMISAIDPLSLARMTLEDTESDWQMLESSEPRYKVLRADIARSIPSILRHEKNQRSVPFKPGRYTDIQKSFTKCKNKDDPWNDSKNWKYLKSTNEWKYIGPSDSPYFQSMEAEKQLKKEKEEEQRASSVQRDLKTQRPDETVHEFEERKRSHNNMVIEAMISLINIPREIPSRFLARARLFRTVHIIWRDFKEAKIEKMNLKRKEVLFPTDHFNQGDSYSGIPERDNATMRTSMLNRSMANERNSLAAGYRTTEAPGWQR